MFAISLGDEAELRPLEPWQAEEFVAHMDRARDLVDQHIMLARAATDLASARALLTSYAEKQAADSGRIYGIWLGSTLVGGVLFRVFDAKAGNCEVGCWLEPAATGRGLVTRAARVLIDWAVEERGIHRVEWQVSTANEPSIKVARRLGMTREGVLRENYLFDGVRRDTEVWSVLAPEWRKQKAADAV
ncbi:MULTISPECIES: GNAT family protein [unclassified Streptomyces]|uniref:GNAT family N-acetyltransferase n=1 Tax=unclassified Streptomyces TaxID=2593676 RepID=UPI00081D8B64|nr:MULTISPECIES: GNAT family protein [unclassified Streptomyces]MYZ34104.1 GNAT family N-acetyltransferase [Streptomyces sp. SID4917]SCF64175.1 Protein N-acetyltransferase, RimJ/RimL family [Streptomyces sp. MnatMP-M17]